MRESGLRWTIVRPTMIYGSELDKNMRKLIRFLDLSPVFPVFGSGENLWQPVYYKDCAYGLLTALERSTAAGQSYDLPGAEPLTYNDLVRTAAAALGKKPRIFQCAAGAGTESPECCRDAPSSVAGKERASVASPGG